MPATIFASPGGDGEGRRHRSCQPPHWHPRRAPGSLTHHARTRGDDRGPACPGQGARHHGGPGWVVDPEGAEPVQRVGSVGQALCAGRRSGCPVGCGGGMRNSGAAVPPPEGRDREAEGGGRCADPVSVRPRRSTTRDFVGGLEKPRLERRIHVRTADTLRARREGGHGAGASRPHGGRCRDRPCRLTGRRPDRMRADQRWPLPRITRMGRWRPDGCART